MSKKVNKKQFSIRLDMEVYKQLDAYRWDNHKMLNDVITEAIKKFLEENQEAMETKPERK